MRATGGKYRFAYLSEVTPGTTPGTAMKLMRTTGGGGDPAASSTDSDELGLNEVPDLIRTGMGLTGKQAFELSYGAIDDLLPGIFGQTDWTANVLTVGSTKRTFTFEDQYTDAGIYVPWKGSLVDQFGIAFQKGGKVTGSLGYTALTAPVAAGASAGTGAATAAPTNDIMDSIGSVQLAQEGGSGSLITVGLTAMSLEITRPSIVMDGCGSLDALQVDPDRFTMKGSFSIYLQDSTLFAKYMNNTSTTLGLTLGGSASKKYAFLMSKVRLAAGKISDAAKATPFIQTYGFSAVYDATNTSCKVTRTP